MTTDIDPETGASTHPQSHGVNRTLADKAGDILPLLDFSGLLLTGYFCLLTQFDLSTSIALRHLILITAAIGPFILYDGSFTTEAYAGNSEAIARRYSGRLLMFGGVIFTIAYAGRWLDQNRYADLVLWILPAIMLLTFSRLLLLQYLRGLRLQGASPENVAVIGRGPLVDHLVPLLRGNAQLYGLYNDAIYDSPRGHLETDQSIDDLIKLADISRPGRILIALPSLDERILRSLVDRLIPLGIPVDLCPQQAGLALQTQTNSHIGGLLPITLLVDRPIKQWNAVLKSVEDLILSFIITISLAPLLLCIALAIKLDSPGPILFTQRRHGHKNSEFNIYKFRTMYVSSDSSGTEMKQTFRGDRRVTRVGRFLRKSSLDELPQMINVLTGSMSLVGPRPHAVDMRTEGYLGHEVVEDYLHRHRVKPGITGWSQANGCRGATDTKAQLRRRIELDLYYVENWSLLFDMKILLMTFREVLRTTNAY